MFINSVYIKDFKNLKNFNLKFPLSEVMGIDKGIKLRLSILVGENGTAKTTLLELIIQSFMNAPKSNYELNYLLDEKKLTISNNSSPKSEELLPKNIVISTYTPIDKLNISEREITNSLIEIKKTNLNENNFKSTAFRIFKNYISDKPYDIHNILDYVGYGKRELYFEISEHALKVNIDRAVNSFMRNKNNKKVEEYIQENPSKEKVYEYQDQLRGSSKRFSNKVESRLRRMEEARLRANYNSRSNYDLAIQEKFYLESIVIEMTFILEKLKLVSQFDRHNFKAGKRRLINISDIDNRYPGGRIQLNKDLRFMSFFEINNLVTDIWIEQNYNEEKFPVSSMSSGELSLLIRFLDLYEYVEDGSIVLIDEPETHLHPKWIREYIEKLIEILGEKKCHVIIATHSPLIISDVTQDCIIAFKKINNEILQVNLEEKTLGMNYEEVLSEVFGLEDYKGSMIENYVKKIDQLLKEAKVDEALKIYNQLGDSTEKYNLYKKIKHVIGEKDV